MTYYDVNTCRLFKYDGKVWLLDPRGGYNKMAYYCLINLSDWSLGDDAHKSLCKEIKEPELTKVREAILYFYNMCPPKT